MLSRYGIYRGVLASAIADDTWPIDRLVRSILTKTSEELDGLALALTARIGPDAFARDLASLLDRREQEVSSAVWDFLSAVGEDFALTGAEAVALVLADEGARIAVAYAGTSELALCDSFARIPDIRLVNGRGDKESAFMAAGASLLLPMNGVAVLHGARGLTNAAGAVADVRRNEIGTLFVVGLPSTGSDPFLPPHAEYHLLESIGKFVKWWWQAGPVSRERPGREAEAIEFVSALRTAIDHACGLPLGPTMFGLPQDVAETAWIPWHAVAPSTHDVSRPRPAADMIAAAVKIVANSRRVIVLVDDYALRYEQARPAISRFATAARAPVLQVRYRRGPMLFERMSHRDVPSFLGWLDYADPFHRDLLAEADLIVTVEDRNIYKRVVGDLPPCRKVAITSDAAKVWKNKYLTDADLLVEGHPMDVLESLSAGMESLGLDGQAVWWEQLRRGDGSIRIEGKPCHEALALRLGIVRVLAETFSRLSHPILVDDSQMFGGLISEVYDELPSHLRVVGDHGGFVGGGLAYSTGLALGEPEANVFCTLGDQGFTNGVQGLVVAGQERPPIVYLVCNNGEAVSLLKQSEATQERWFDGGRHPHLHNPVGLSYARLAEAFRIRSGIIEFPVDRGLTAVEEAVEHFRRLLAEAVDAGEPSLLELRLPRRGPAWDGIWLTQGLDEPLSAGRITSGPYPMQ